MSEVLILLYCPFPNLEAARTVATALLDARLVACCNLLPAMESHYRWNETLTMSQEVVLLAKTTENAASLAVARIEALHPYDVPAILRLQATANPAFAQWVSAETRSAK